MAAARRADALREYLQGVLCALAQRPGLTGGHLLRTDTPAIAPTQEQKIRGGADAAADWVMLAGGYDTGTLRALAQAELGAQALLAAGAAAAPQAGVYELRLAMTPADLRTSASTSV